MSKIINERGFIIFGGLILVFLALSLAAYVTSGHMGIEERFNNAVGISADSDEEGPSGLFGFNIEGNIQYYMIIASALVIISAFLYMRPRM